MPEPTVAFALKLPVDLDRRIRDHATTNEISINATIIALLIESMKLDRSRE